MNQGEITWDENMHQDKKKLPMVNFLIFGQMNIKGFQKMKIRPFQDFEKNMLE